mgnify:CR=1 FL=1
MIKCFLINNVENEFVPKSNDFKEWLKAFEYKEQAEINIKIVTPKEMRNFNKLYKNEDKVSDTLAFTFENLTIEDKVILGDIAMCANKINIDSDLHSKKTSCSAKARTRPVCRRVRLRLVAVAVPVTGVNPGKFIITGFERLHGALPEHIRPISHDGQALFC